MTQLVPVAPAMRHAVCAYCKVREHAACGGIDGDGGMTALETLRVRPRRLAPGEALSDDWTQGARFYMVLSGWLALRDTARDGREVILRFILPGDGVEVVEDGGTSIRAYQAIGEAIVCSFSPARHQQLLTEFPDYRSRVCANSAAELQSAYSRLAAFAVASARERVAGLLWELAIRSLRRRPERDEAAAAVLNQIEIGLATGLTAVHVSRTLRLLREEAIVEFSQGAIMVRNPVAMERLSRATEADIANWL